MLALIVALVVWSGPAPNLFLCLPGKSPRVPSNCERLHYSVLAKFPANPLP